MELEPKLCGSVNARGVALSNLTIALRNDFSDLIDLGVGDLSFRTPKHICDAAIKAIVSGQTKSTPARGCKQLIEAVSWKLKRDNGLNYASEEIIVSSGAKHALSNVIFSMIAKGDKVVLPTPCWPNYDSLIRMAGGLPQYLRCSKQNNFKIDPDKLERMICRRTRMFIFSSPCNPTGVVYTQAELEALANVFLRYPNVLVVCDEVYEYINYCDGHRSIAQFSGLRDRVILINGLSKGFAMTGWRIGYACGPRSVISACEKIQTAQTSCANAIAQSAGVAALTEDLSATVKMVKRLRRHRDFVIDSLRNIDGVDVLEPQGAFYAFPDLGKFIGLSDGKIRLLTDHDLSMYLLKEKHVATLNGSAFGAGNHVRIAFGVPFDDLKAAMLRIKEALERLA